MSVLATPASIGRAEVDDALGEQVRVHVHDPVTARVLGDDVGDRVSAHDAPFPAEVPADVPAGRSPNVCLRIGITWLNDSAIASTKPYSRASSAVYQWSWRESSKIRSTGWPVSCGDQAEHGVAGVPQVVGLDLDLDRASRRCPPIPGA